MAMRLTLENIGQIRRADLTFGDLTVLVGPQASGKSITLQWIKFLADSAQIQEQLHDYGLDWARNLRPFLDTYFGEGMNSQWIDAKSRVSWNGKTVDVHKRVAHRKGIKKETVFFIPAQRVLALRDGWPRPFGDFSPGDPYVVRAYSEKLRMLMEKELASGEPIFPQERRLKDEYRALLQETVFGEFKLSVDKLRSQKRLVLRQGEGYPLPYMVWSAGQREFVPLLLGLYWLMPPRRTPRRKGLEWIIIEELEMGLHPRAISTVLLLVLELMKRGYRVCLSTHSPQVLDVVWAINSLRENHASHDALLDIFEVNKTQPLRELARIALKKKTKVYYFERNCDEVRDITNLDPSSTSSEEANWGGLLEFSGRANEAVARAVANSQTGD
jgi:hypothetical protein